MTTTETETSVRLSYFARENRYGGTCTGCGDEVAERAGWLFKSYPGNEWVVACDSCSRAGSRAVPIRGDEVVPTNYGGNGSHSATRIHTCTVCSSNVVWIKGSNGWYLANVTASRGTGARKYVPWSPHTDEDCDRVNENRESWVARIEAEAAARDAAASKPEHCERCGEGTPITSPDGLLPGYFCLACIPAATAERDAAYCPHGVDDGVPLSSGEGKCGACHGPAIR